MYNKIHAIKQVRDFVTQMQQAVNRELLNAGLGSDSHPALAKGVQDAFHQYGGLAPSKHLVEALEFDICDPPSVVAQAYIRERAATAEMRLKEAEAAVASAQRIVDQRTAQLAILLSLANDIVK
jgi:hypothetical protein